MLMYLFGHRFLKLLAHFYLSEILIANLLRDVFKGEVGRADARPDLSGHEGLQGR